MGCGGILNPSVRSIMSENEVLWLVDLRPGQYAWVETVEAEPEVRERLMELGFVRGTPVEVVGAAPLGGPLEVRIRGTRLSLRREEAQRIRVRLQSP